MAPKKSNTVIVLCLLAGVFTALLVALKSVNSSIGISWLVALSPVIVMAAFFVLKFLSIIVWLVFAMKEDSDG